MNVICIAHTALSDDFARSLCEDTSFTLPLGTSERAALALTAIRCCYSPLPPTQILPQEGAKYFGSAASDGEGGTESDRLFRHIIRSGHASTTEHITYTFAVEGVSRALLAQLTRHRQLSFSVQSQRYVKFGSDDKAGGFSYVTPASISGNEEACGAYCAIMRSQQAAYDLLREYGVPAEDARMVLPQAATCNLVLTGNLRALLEFYSKRHNGTHAQLEIRQLAEAIRSEITKIDAWTMAFFDHHAK